MWELSVWVLGGVKINFLFSGSRGDDTMTIMTVIVSSVSESLSDVCTAELPGEEEVGSWDSGNTWHIYIIYSILTLSYLLHTYTGICTVIATLLGV